MTEAAAPAGSTEVRLDPDRMQTIINTLKTFADTTVPDAKQTVTNGNTTEKSPFDLASFSSNVDTHCGALHNEVTDLQTCLDAAKAANDCGITTKNPDGTIAYIVPAGAEETVETIKTANSVETWRTAKTDSATLVTYSEKGCTPQQWDALLARMQQYQDDPAYAATILANVGPGRLLDLPIDIGEQFRTTSGSGPARSTSNSRPSAEQDLATVLGHILATGSRSWTDKKASDYASSLAHYAEEEGKGRRIGSLNEILSASQDVDIDGDGQTETVGLDYNDTFLSVLATRLESFNPKGTGFFDKQDTRTTSGDTANPLLGVVHAMTGNPDVATKWLTVSRSDGSVDDQATAERTKKIIGKGNPVGDNQWTDDWMTLSAEESLRGVKDPGGGIAQAAITSGALNTIGTGDDTITLSREARNAASIALSNYVYGLQQSAIPDGLDGWTIPVEGGEWATSMPRQPVIDQKALTNVLGQVGMDDYATTRLAGAQEAFNKQQVAGTMSDDEANLAHVFQSQSNLRGYMAGAIARQSEIDGADTDARVGAWAQAASTAVSAVPLPQTKAAGVALDAGTKFALNAGKSAAAQGAESGIGSLFGGHEDKRKSENEKARNAGSKANTDIEVLSVLGSGVYTREELAAIAQSNKGVGIASVLSPDGDLLINPDTVDPDNPALTPDQKNALKHLADTLPVGNHPGMADFGDNSRKHYGEGYDQAHNQKR